MRGADLAISRPYTTTEVIIGSSCWTCRVTEGLFTRELQISIKEKQSGTNLHLKTAISKKVQIVELVILYIFCAPIRWMIYFAISYPKVLSCKPQIYWFFHVHLFLDPPRQNLFSSQTCLLKIQSIEWFQGLKIRFGQRKRRSVCKIWNKITCSINSWQLA